LLSLQLKAQLEEGQQKELEGILAAKKEQWKKEEEENMMAKIKSEVCSVTDLF